MQMQIKLNSRNEAERQDKTINSYRINQPISISLPQIYMYILLLYNQKYYDIINGISISQQAGEEYFKTGNQRIFDPCGR